MRTALQSIFFVCLNRAKIGAAFPYGGPQSTDCKLAIESLALNGMNPQLRTKGDGIR